MCSRPPHQEAARGSEVAGVGGVGPLHIYIDTGPPHIYGRVSVFQPGLCWRAGGSSIWTDTCAKHAVPVRAPRVFALV